jgi:carboxypeptidase family protein
MHAPHNPAAEGAEEANMQWTKRITDPLWAAWAEAESLAVRMTLTATVVVLSVACGSKPFQPPTAPPPEPPTFALTGTVMEARAGVRSLAWNVSVEISPTHRILTDRAGNFSIPGLAEGTYALHVRSPLHEPLSTTVAIQGDTRIDLEIVVLPVYAVSGIVYEDTEDGPIPVPGVYVNNSEIHSSAGTDAAGAYRVLALSGCCADLVQQDRLRTPDPFDCDGRRRPTEREARPALSGRGYRAAAGAHDISGT